MNSSYDVKFQHFESSFLYTVVLIVCTESAGLHFNLISISRRARLENALRNYVVSIWIKDATTTCTLHTHGGPSIYKLLLLSLSSSSSSLLLFFLLLLLLLSLLLLFLLHSLCNDLSYRLVDPEFGSWQGKRFFCFPKRSGELWDPLSLLLSRYS